MKYKLSKKYRYILQTLVVTSFLYYFALDPTSRSVSFFLIGIALNLMLSFIVHLPNSKIINTLVTNILSLALITGYMLSLYFFPNLSMVFRLVTLGMFSLLYYLILLVNNIFLVVEDRGESIPLYRVAQTWSKILMAAVAIPILAGVYKLAVYPYYEVLLSILISLAIYVYLIWSLKFSPEVKKYKIGEIITLLIFCVFMVGCASLSVSFFPTESFLRALFVSSLVMFGVTFIENHLKNLLTKKIVTEHIAISFLFLILLFIFES